MILQVISQCVGMKCIEVPNSIYGCKLHPRILHLFTTNSLQSPWEFTDVKNLAHLKGSVS